MEARSVMIRKAVELRQFGYTHGCPGCDAAMHDLPKLPHSSACRARIEVEMYRSDALRKRLVGRKRDGQEAGVESGDTTIEQAITIDDQNAAVRAAGKRSAEAELVRIATMADDDHEHIVSGGTSSSSGTTGSFQPTKT